MGRPRAKFQLPVPMLRYLEHRPRPAGASTRRLYARILKHAKAIDDDGNVLVTDPEVLAQHLRDARAKNETQRRRTASNGTLLPRYAAVRHFCIACLGLTEAEATAILPPPRGLKIEHRDPIDDEQIPMYFRAVRREFAPGPERTILLLLPHTGLRISEACNLRLDDVQPQGERHELRVVGKGGKARTVPLTKAAFAVIDEYRRNWRDARGAEVPWLFLNLDEDGPTDPQRVRLCTRKLRAAYPKLGKKLSPHVLRHVFGTQAAKTLNLAAVQSLLGHESPETTVRYISTTQAQMAKGLEDAEIDPTTRPRNGR